VTLLGVLVFLMVAGFLFTTVQSELAPAEDVGILSANIAAPEGTGYEAMDKYMRKRPNHYSNCWTRALFVPLSSAHLAAIRQVTISIQVRS